jgi:hypothetical protein
VNRLVYSAWRVLPLVHPVPLVPLVPPFPSGALPWNGINVALMPLSRQRCGIDAVDGEQAR